MYDITDYTRERARKLGYTVKASVHRGRKIDVFKGDKYITSLGDTRYGDYSSFIESKGRPYAEERRRLYHLRHTHPTLREKLGKLLLW
jgi:hypothetical protein